MAKTALVEKKNPQPIKNPNVFPQQSPARASQLLEKLRKSHTDIFQDNNMLDAAREIAKKGSDDEKKEALKIIFERGKRKIPEIIRESKDAEMKNNGNTSRVQLEVLRPISLYLDAAKEISPDGCGDFADFVDKNYGKRLVEVFGIILRREAEVFGMPIPKGEDFLKVSELLMTYRELNMHAPAILGLPARDFHDICALFCKSALQKGEELNKAGKTLSSGGLKLDEQRQLLEADSVRALLEGQPGNFFPVSLAISTFKSYPEIEREVRAHQEKKFGSIFPA